MSHFTKSYPAAKCILHFKLQENKHHKVLFLLFKILEKEIRDWRKINFVKLSKTEKLFCIEVVLYTI